MSDVLNACWVVLLWLYRSIRDGGFTGCGIALLVSLILFRWGIRLTGRNEVNTVHQSPGQVVPWVEHKPAVPGTANNWFESLLGRLMVIGGAILMIVTICASITVILVELMKSSAG
jgi:hypothetical protein